MQDLHCNKILVACFIFLCCMILSYLLLLFDDINVSYYLILILKLILYHKHALKVML